MGNFDIAKKELACFMRKRRKDLKLTQEEISRIAFINRKTIYRLESGTVLPQYDTLYILSNVYKVDLNKKFQDSLLNNIELLNKLNKKIDLAIESENNTEIENALKELNIIESKYSDSEIFHRLIRQRIVFGEANILRNIGLEDISLKKFIEAIKITIPEFHINRIEDFYINIEMEIRILLNIAILYGRKENYDKGIVILEYLNKETEDIKTKIKILHTLSGIYYRKYEYEIAKDYIDKALVIVKEHEIYDLLPYLYYQKSIVKKMLDLEGYIDDFNKAIFLCEIYGKEELKKRLMNGFYWREEDEKD